MLQWCKSAGWAAKKMDGLIEFTVVQLAVHNSGEPLSVRFQQHLSQHTVY